jgi:hypothetical protein
MATPRRDEVVAELEGLAAGIQKNLATFTFIVGGVAYSGAQALAFVQSAIASEAAISTARAALHEAIVTNKTFLAGNAPTLKALRSMIALMYANDSTSLNDFAMEPKKKRTPMSAETLVLRAAKSRATRVERKTMGKRQRAAIKGTVTGVVIEPVTTEKNVVPEQGES